MNKNDNLNKLRDAFKKAFLSEVIVPVQPVIEEVKLASTEITLVDGTLAQVDKLEVGGIVTLADGTIAPDGDIKLQDGSLLVITGGVIAEIKPATDETPVEEAQVEQAAAPVETPVAETPAEENTEDTKVADLEARIAKLEEAMASMMGANQAMNKTIVEMSEVPAAEAVISDKRFAKQRQLTADEARIERAIRMTNSLRG